MLLSSLRKDLSPGETSVPIIVQQGWGGRIWNNSTQTHAHTIAEFFIDDVHGDYYDISIVDGFDTGIMIAPSAKSCETLRCSFDMKLCPGELLETSMGPCLSACSKYTSPEFCCTGAHNTPDTCPANEWSLYFKKLCPDAYTYAYDDPTSIRVCKDPTAYEITFCP